MSELAEGARLEIVCVVYSGTEGSNPSLSATTFCPHPAPFPSHPFFRPLFQISDGRNPGGRGLPPAGVWDTLNGRIYEHDHLGGKSAFKEPLNGLSGLSTKIPATNI